MELNEFVTKFANQFEESDIKKVHAEVRFRDLATWDSLTGMAVLTMIQDELNIELTVEEFLKFNTPTELYNFLKTK